MPTYEYRCPKGHHFELVQRMSDEPGAECPTCGASSERILSGGAGFLFKGEGFYITDYRSEDYRKAAKAEEKHRKGDGDSGAPGEGGGEAAKKAAGSEATKPSSADSTGRASDRSSTASGSSSSSKSED